jgi:hypothetical protein
MSKVVKKVLSASVIFRLAYIGEARCLFFFCFFFVASTNIFHSMPPRTDFELLVANKKLLLLSIPNSCLLSISSWTASIKSTGINIGTYFRPLPALHAGRNWPTRNFSASSFRFSILSSGT